MIPTGITINGEIIYFHLYDNGGVYVDLCNNRKHHIVPYNLFRIDTNGILLAHAIGDQIDTDKKIHSLIIEGVDIL